MGEPLPMTCVRIAEDGEVLVRGPQVTSGYFGEGADEPFRDGWLSTGDLGRLTDDGSLVLFGRKKELIVTSYGKNVWPTRVEAMLREIPGVREAMVVGDGRPYCTALLWVNPPDTHDGDGAFAAAIDRAVGEVNSHLSRPEQVKRWAVLPYDLSIERGDLTANLKLRRHAIAGRYSGVLATLYGRPGPAACGLGLPGRVIHVGGAPKEGRG